MQLLSSHLSRGCCAHHRLPMQTRLSFFLLFWLDVQHWNSNSAKSPPSLHLNAVDLLGSCLFARDAICSPATLRKSTGGIISTPCSPNPLSTPSNSHQCAHSLLPLRKTKTKNEKYLLDLPCAQSHERFSNLCIFCEFSSFA